MMKNIIALVICFLTIGIAAHERVTLGAAGMVETLTAVFSILLIPFIVSDMKCRATKTRMNKLRG